MDEKISVIIPIYNAGACLTRCLNSILAANYKNLEIICVNDGSTDGSDEVLAHYAKTDARFLIISQENRGVSAARNAGLCAASGDFITFIDADDRIHPQYFSALMTQLRIHRADVAVCNIHHTQNASMAPEFPDTPLQGHVIGLDAAVNLKHVRTHTTGRIYRKTLLTELAFPVGMLPEDTIFSLQTFCQTPPPKIVYLPEKLYLYCKHPGSLTSQINGPDSLTAASAIYQLAAAVSDAPQQAYILETALRMGLSSWYLLYVYKNRPLRRDTAKLLRRCSREFRKLPCVPRKKQLQFTLLSGVPQIYRILRRIDDPTLGPWEKKIKAQLHR